MWKVDEMFSVECLVWNVGIISPLAGFVCVGKSFSIIITPLSGLKNQGSDK